MDGANPVWQDLDDGFDDVEDKVVDGEGAERGGEEGGFGCQWPRMRWDVCALAEFIRQSAVCVCKVQSICQTGNDAGARSGVVVCAVSESVWMVAIGFGRAFAFGDAWEGLAVLEDALGSKSNVQGAGYGEDGEGALAPVVNMESGMSPGVAICRGDDGQNNDGEQQHAREKRVLPAGEVAQIEKWQVAQQRLQGCSKGDGDALVGWRDYGVPDGL